MKKVIKFTKIRAFTFILSLALMAGGIVFIITNGFNFGIDFLSGLRQQVQISPAAADIVWSGDEDVSINVKNDILSVKIERIDGPDVVTFSFDQFPTLSELKSEMAKVQGLDLALKINGSVSSAELIALDQVSVGQGSKVRLNVTPAAVSDLIIDIEDIRTLIAGVESLNGAKVTSFGDDADQHFSIVVANTGDSKSFQEDTSRLIVNAFNNKYGSENVLKKGSEYIGPTLANKLWKQTGLLFIVIIALIMIYIWVRFKITYAVSAIAALLHDVILMFCFISVFNIEFSNMTIVAILTIVGYSLNDTIVVFDRVRENSKLLKDTKIKTIINTSITQSLSRTVITSVTTLLAVVALYVFAAGVVKVFALNIIFGIVIGTYSSIFIASPVYLALTNAKSKRKAVKDEIKFGGVAAAASKHVATGNDVVDSSEKKILEIPQIDRKLKGKRKTKK